MGIPDCSNFYSIYHSYIRNAKNKYLIGPDGQQLGIIPDAKKDQPKVEKTIQQTAVNNNKKKRNYLLLGLLAIILAIFFYWCFGDDWISIGILPPALYFLSAFYWKVP